MRLHVIGMAWVEYITLRCGFGGYQKDSYLLELCRVCNRCISVCKWK